MKLEEHYDKLWKQSLQKFKRQEFEFDPFLDAENDAKYGITLLARPSRAVKQNISKAIQRIRAIAPHQYYYPNSDLHITILSIISCYAGFSLDQIEQSAYQELVYSAIGSISRFNIQFRGLAASPSCILVQGFPEDHQLETLRNVLRRKFKQSNLQHSIDKRYQLQTAHITAIRFKEFFSETENFIKTVAELKDKHFGSCTIDQIELVGNNWYQQKEKVKPIARFALSKQEQKYRNC